MSLSLESISHALGGTSTAGEQLKNPWGCTKEGSFVDQTNEKLPEAIKYVAWTN